MCEPDLLVSLAVKLEGLKPGTLYYYKVTGTNGYEAAYLPTFKFRTARAAGDEESFTIATFADLGLMGDDGLSTATGPFGGSAHATLEPGETNTIQSMLALADTYDFAVHVGDVGYADYALKEFVQGLWGSDNATTQPTRQDVADHCASTAPRPRPFTLLKLTRALSPCRRVHERAILRPDAPDHGREALVRLSLSTFPRPPLALFPRALSTPTLSLRCADVL